MKIIMIIAALMCLGTLAIFFNETLNAYKQKKYFQILFYLILCLISLATFTSSILATIQFN
jgi:predicted membrane channel-forming protein YqfA (hemolysin III family)